MNIFENPMSDLNAKNTGKIHWMGYVHNNLKAFNRICNRSYKISKWLNFIANICN